jgi:L-asparaginase / beta-aspartyl-peptidase
VIAMDRAGNWTMPFNSTGMFRGRVGADGQPHVAIFHEEP